MNEVKKGMGMPQIFLKLILLTSEWQGTGIIPCENPQNNKKIKCRLFSSLHTPFFLAFPSKSYPSSFRQLQIIHVPRLLAILQRCHPLIHLRQRLVQQRIIRAKKRQGEDRRLGRDIVLAKLMIVGLGILSNKKTQKNVLLERCCFLVYIILYKIEINTKILIKNTKPDVTLCEHVKH